FPCTTLFRSLFMGLGQLYNRQFVKGIAFALLELCVLLCGTRPFMHAMWGLVTLGETVQQRNARGAVVVMGDHSIMLMIEGISFVFLLLMFIAVYVFIVRDAYVS